jgi:hypothetical protein
VALLHHRRDPLPRLLLEPSLPRRLGGLELGDLVADRGEHALALAQLALDRAAPRRPVRDLSLLRRARLLQLGLALLHGPLERLHLAEDARVLRGDSVDRVEAVQEVVERLGAEQHLDRGGVVAVDVERDEPLREMPLRPLEARLRELQMARVLLQVVLDLRQPDVREVEALDRVRELRVDLADLVEHALGLRALLRDRRVGGGRMGGGQAHRCEHCREQGEDYRRLVLSRANTRLPTYAAARSSAAPRLWGPVRHKHGTLAAESDDRNPQQSQKWRVRT